MEEETAVELAERYTQIMRPDEIADSDLLKAVSNVPRSLTQRGPRGEYPSRVISDELSFIADGTRWLTFTSNDWFHVASSPVYNPREIEKSDFSPTRTDPIFCYLDYTKGWSQLQRVVPRNRRPHWSFVPEKAYTDDYKAALAIEDHMNRMSRALKSPNATLVRI
ncbi:hypothetical protein A2631_05485 [Candidatus Daviesbacteria bacterium RIFCSPHIGHO2_01_FULL_44_29]|uniref:Uncharacterized protein n=1 Tax=Candidatus Daviesbacteria bacterium RIFCSPHIGHO2_02_FULL_43_12 TaxID=1797776 RepID=A0A1F5KI80_9BACT|nr:MAG: hypothetical protein A2631_05485 [Candidatus Daviesbacteria bacterium RIFCSPHIGHO2_01_FULL_44_29]OGE39200.1 MAG: hypothetical protein A3E86_01230 [Candidatus Daviesbacteria bacterium RIFCSPHIGHO2_12_FULL_47_45]OGE40598.1 MAG: hypothetical protein A3D25_00580 [Candidatus Daviesbacteria bacterium RIFCSPHIGHO2_02_FULL_43_12]OGE70158.1 MAG: hypothetical protein A3B55_00350 [Candidatus Daviesbacteria bacterium RIFCSPLOWO2_01_FULL_43_15]